ncbi:VWA domain-containing protein [Paenibacillus sp. J31TS4]|uniref:vWA domain-containing protein n=1 Tax=Paenibacillus sp. J31TS4 TaxID=2807195 RepID=UPI001BD0E517|nr:VWA domain-containing protein [Paenibacillus sp. J31TS4]
MVRRLAALLALTVLMAGCAKEPDRGGEAKGIDPTPSAAAPSPSPAKPKVEAAMLPSKLEDLLQYPKGPLAGAYVADQKDAVMKTVKEKLPKLGGEATQEDYDAYASQLISLFYEEFPDPSKVLSDYKLAAFGTEDAADPRFQLKDNFNVEIVLDASGSMGGKIEGRTKMETAKEAIQQFVGGLPTNAKVGLRVYGHKGTGSDADKALSCSSSELVYPVQPYNAETLNAALGKFAPAGWTPLTLALDEAQKDLSAYPAETNTNIIYLVSDGINTCEGDPVQKAAEIAKSNIQPILNVIGFDVDNAGQKQLKEMAAAAGGFYTGVQTKDELMGELNKGKKMAERWKQWQQSAKTSAFYANSAKQFDITTYSTSWMWRSLRLDRNLSNTANALREEKYITDEAYQAIIKKTSEYVQYLNKTNDSVTAELRKTDQSNYEALKRKIDELYETGSKQSTP